MRTFHFINSICDTWSSRRLNVKILIKTNLTMKGKDNNCQILFPPFETKLSFLEILLIIVNILLLKNVNSKSIVNGQRDTDIDPNLCLNIPDETLLNNPSSCEAFYVCRNGHPEASFCPTELYFDPITSSCNFAEQVDCVQDESVAQDHIECPIVSDTNKIVYIPSSVYCERYYICYRGKETLVHCKPGSHWNPKINKCDAPQNVDCKVVVILSRSSYALINFYNLNFS